MGIILKSFKLQKYRHKVDGNSWPSDVGESKINVTNIDELLLYKLQLLHLNRFTVLVHQTGRMWTSNCQSDAVWNTISRSRCSGSFVLTQFWLCSRTQYILNRPSSPTVLWPMSEICSSAVPSSQHKHLPVRSARMSIVPHVLRPFALACAHMLQSWLAAGLL